MRRPLFLLAFPVVLVALAVSGLFKTVLAPTAPAAGATVHGVLFWSPGCAACEQVLSGVLPPLEDQFGEQLQVQRVELASIEDFDVLFEAAGQVYGLPANEVGVPFLVVGERALVGSEAIARGLPEAVTDGLAAGGLAVPALPEGLQALVDRRTPEQAANGVDDACGLKETACAPLP